MGLELMGNCFDFAPVARGSRARVLRAVWTLEPLPPRRLFSVTPVMELAPVLPLPGPQGTMQLSVSASNDTATATIADADSVALLDEFRANTSLSNTQRQPAIAMNADGQYVVTWSSNHTDAANYGIYAQRFDKLGNPRGTQIHVNVTTALQQTHPTVAIDSAGNFVVAWSSQEQDGSGWGIIARRFNTYGTALTDEIAINQATLGNQTDPAIACSPNGQFVVTWTSDTGGAQADVMARRFNPDATPVGDEFRVNTTLPGLQDQPAVAMDSSGRFVVAWRSNGQDGSGAGVFARRFDASGTPTSGEFQVNLTTVADQDKPAVALASDGSFVIAWSSVIGRGSSAYEIFARVFDAAGVARTDEFQVNTTSAGWQDTPTVAVESAGHFVVAWSSSSQDGSGKGIYARRFDPSGAAMSGELRVNGTTLGNQELPAAVVSAVGSVVVVWQGPGYGDSFGVFGRYDRTTNVAPLERPGIEDTPLIFHADENGLSVIGTERLRVTLAVTNGTLTLAALTGLTFVAGDGIQDNAMSFEGLPRDINNALSNLRFDPTSEFSGNARLSIMTSSLSGRTLSDLDTIDLPVAPVNDEPVLTANNGLTIDAGRKVVLTREMLELQDLDTPAGELIYTLTADPSNGKLLRDGVAMTAGDSFTQAEVDGGRIEFAQSGAGDTDAFGFVTSDGIDDGPASSFVIAIQQPPPPAVIPTPLPPATPQPPRLPRTAVFDPERAPTAESSLSSDETSDEDELELPDEASGGDSPAATAAAPVAPGKDVASPAEQVNPTVSDAQSPTPETATADPASSDTRQAQASPPPSLNELVNSAGVSPFDGGSSTVAPAPTPVVEPATESDAPAVALPPAQPVAFIARPDGVMSETLDQVAQQITQDEKSLRLVVGSASFASLGLSVAYVLWTIRAGSLLASLLSAMPAWTCLDPLPILDNFQAERKRKRDGEDSNDDGEESLQSLVNQPAREGLPGGVS